jgi:hypothetical protein
MSSTRAAWEWWFGLKLRRQGSKPIPLRDKSGARFILNMVDPLPESLHHVESLAHGVISLPCGMETSYVVVTGSEYTHPAKK